MESPCLVKEVLRLRVILLAITGIGPAILLDQLSQSLITRYFAEWIPILEALDMGIGLVVWRTG
jgi:hypothetical protein